MINLFGESREPVADAIARFRHFEPPDGYWLAFSGGKDSVALKRLAQMAVVKFDAHYSMTTIDPPELVRFIRDVHPDVVIDRPPKSFFQLVPIHGFPLRRRRWCCKHLKENGGRGRLVAMGVRWAESARRKNRQMVEQCRKGRRVALLSPMIDWTDAEVWSFIRSEHVPYCSLYDEGFTRLGCIACPMQSSGQRKMEINRWPRFRRAFLLAFDKLIQDRRSKGKWNDRAWPDAEALLKWWLSDAPAPQKTQEWFSFD